MYNYITNAHKTNIEYRIIVNIRVSLQDGCDLKSSLKCYELMFGGNHKIILHLLFINDGVSYQSNKHMFVCF